MSTSSSSLDYLSGLALGSELGIGVGGQAPASVPSLLSPTPAQTQASALLALSSLPLHLPQMVTKTKKVFVGGVPTSSTVDELRDYFAQFGKARNHYLNMHVLVAATIVAIRVLYELLGSWHSSGERLECRRRTMISVPLENMYIVQCCTLRVCT